MTITAPSYATAEILRKNKEYDKAIEQFGVLWEKEPTQMIGWRYANCLRKLGKSVEAEQVARAALTKYPQDQYTKNELGWILYDKELKPAREESDLGRVIHAANEILALNSDKFTLPRVVLSVMKVAKGRGKWAVVLEWADKVKPPDLESEPIMFDGKRGMSDRETWYIGQARALLELERYTEARAQALVALQEIPDEIFLMRTAALALARSGDLQGGAAEMHKLLTHRRADWYVKADLAELEYRLGNHTEAFRLMCEAVSNQQDNEYKLGYFVTLAQITLALNKPDVAAEHVALAKAVRAANNWSVPADLLQLEKAILGALNVISQPWPELPQDANQLSKICNQRWREGMTVGVTFHRGAVMAIHPNKSFAFITPDEGGENVFVLVRDLPRECAKEGARVEYTLENSFDRKKNRESTKAVKVRCLK